MKILKKSIVSIIIFILVVYSFVPSSYADFTQEQEKQMQTFLKKYVDNYGGYDKSTYSQGEVRGYIYDYKVATEHKWSYRRDTQKDIYGTITADCSTFASFVYIETCNLGLRGWSTDSFKQYVGKTKESGKTFYDVGLLKDVTLKPGDLILAKGNGVGHIMVYYGGNKIAHMSSSKDLVIVDMGWVYTYYPSDIVHVLRINDNIVNGNLDTAVKDVDSTYTPPDDNNNGDSSNDTPSDTSNDNTYVDPKTGEDLGLNPDDFQYYGLPEVTNVQMNKPWIVLKLSDIIDYLVGMMILFPKMAFIGYTEIIEMMISSGLDAAVGLDISEYTSNIFTFIMNSSRNVTIEKIVYNRIPILDVNVFDFSALTQYTGTGEDSGASRDANSYKIITVIKEKIAVWYYVFRNVTIIAMLVVLIYIGIRMAITTIAEEKAKYKSLLTAWIVSFIIVIGIHYFMIIIMQLNNNFIDLIIPKSIEGQEISLYETVRSRAYELKASRAIVGTVLYMLLVWYTVKFLLIYAKRFLSIMILILLAPFASASFAITKIKDGKTPIFDNWIKEYTFNIIIQGIHALLYTYFVTVALELGQKNLIGVVLAFVLIKFMTKADGVVRKIFKLRSGTKYSTLDNNLSAANDIAGLISGGGLVGMFAGSTLGKAYINKWVKPVYKKSFNFAKGLLNIPYQGVRAGIITGARAHMDGKNYDPNSRLNPFINAIASSTLLNERQAVLDKYGNPVMGADGKALFTDNMNWQQRGEFIFGKDGTLKYVEVKRSNRAVQSDIDRFIAVERARVRAENKARAKALLSMGVNAIKGSAYLMISIPLMIDSPAIGFTLFTRAYSSLSPFYKNRKSEKIKGYRKTISTKKYTFKDFGKNTKTKIYEVIRESSKHPVRTAGKTLAFATGATMLTKPMENSKEMILELAQASQKESDKLKLLYEIRETEADTVEHAKYLADVIKNIKSMPNYIDIADDVTKEMDKALEEYAKKLYSEEIYNQLGKNIKDSVKDFRVKNKLRNFINDYAKQKNVNTKLNKFDLNNFEKRIQDEIRKSAPNFVGQNRAMDLNTATNKEINQTVSAIKKAVGMEKNSEFEQKFKDKLEEIKLNGQNKVEEIELIDITKNIMQSEDIRKNLRKINPKISGKTESEEFEAKINDIETVKEEIRNAYGEKLGRKFEENIDKLVQNKIENNEDTIKEKELQDFVIDEIKTEEMSRKALFTAKDIDGMKDEIDKFMRENGADITFDEKLEEKIKNKINDKNNTTTVKTENENTDEKAITGKELQDILYKEIEDREKPDENPILTKEEVLDLVNLIQDKVTDKDMKLGKEFEQNIQKLMEEEIVKNTIEEHAKTKYGDLTDELSIEKLEKKINSKLNSNGYDEKAKEILATKDIISDLQDTIKENLEVELENKDIKSRKTDVAKLSELVIEASRLENSVKRELPYMGVSKELAQDIEKLRALNYKAKKLGIKRKERNGKKLRIEEPVTDINNLVKDIWNGAK